MKSNIIKRTQKVITVLKRQKSAQSEQSLRISSIAERNSQTSSNRNLHNSKNRFYSKSMTKNAISPYDNFIKEMKIKLPTPKEKFYEFLKIQPFNRIQSQNQLIALFLKTIKFFKMHHDSLIMSLSKKVRMVEKSQLDEKMMVVVLQGDCVYQNNIYGSGQLINRQQLKPKMLKIDPSIRLLTINRHEYMSFISSYIHDDMIKFKQFINNIQTFKMFSQKTLQKFTENLSLNYYLKGENLYKIGDQAGYLFVVLSGKVSRKVVIEIQKINKIPHKRFEREVRILSKSYSHQIQFYQGDIVGVTEIIDNVPVRKQQIHIDQDTIILGIDRAIIEENMDDYVIDRLKKYNLKKYPSNYDQLCSNYMKQKQQMKKTEERKILALKNELKTQCNYKRTQKIQSIIRIYQQNIRLVQQKNLLSRKLTFQKDINK